MAKKSKDDVPNPSGIANRDILQRMNFLYQASVLLNNMGESPAAPVPQENEAWPSGPFAGASSLPQQFGQKEEPQPGRKNRHPTTCVDLSRVYVKSMKAIGKKTNVRMDPGVKRTLCKVCNIVLMPGATATVRVKSSSTHGNMMVYTCMSCRTRRRIPAPPTLRPLTQMPVSTVQDPAAVTAHGADDMDLDDAPKTQDPTMHKRRGRKRKIARDLPFFERDIGHVLFKGNEVVAIMDRSRFMCS